MQCHKGSCPGSFSHPNPWQHHQQSGLAPQACVEWSPEKMSSFVPFLLKSAAISLTPLSPPALLGYYRADQLKAILKALI